MMTEVDETLYTEASLSDSVIFKSFNNNAAMSTLILTAIKDSIIIDNKYISTQLEQLIRTRPSPLTDDVIAAYNKGDIVLIYSKIKKVPQMIPFFATKMNGEVKVFVFVNNYGTITGKAAATGEQTLNITARDLYVLMEGAYTSYMYAVYPARLNKNLSLMKTTCSVYTFMVMRILNKNYAISMDQELYSNTVFCVSKFFLENVWETTNKDIIFSYARGNINTGRGVNIAELDRITQEFEINKIKTIDQLINYLKNLSPRLKDLNFRFFIQCYIDLFKPGAIFGLECLPYFLYVIEASMLGSFIINQPIISDIIKTVKGMNTFYPELTKAISM